ncbi:DHHA1 domain-containing protein [Methyloprofundus sp.]|uniref:DHHA1 domain-containing protein n=1 Tax=Methyloprofundus sp. TaxID=2020875 RepID=UPI003D0A0066
MSIDMKGHEVAVLYHADCLDGYAAAWSAWKSLGKTAEYQAVRHQMPIPEFSEGAVLYILDFCYPIEQLRVAAQKASKIIVLDHHISAQQAVDAFQGELPANLQITFNMQQSGCMIAWQYFHGDLAPPMILSHIQDHDLWRHQIAHTEEITRALFLRRPLAFSSFEKIELDALFREGKVLLKQQRQMVKTLLNSRHSIKLNDAVGLAVNAPGAFSSDLGQALAKLSGTFGLTYHYHGKRQCYECGLRSIGEFDVSQIAVAFGGGGHQNAAGFSIDRKTFLACLP